MKNIIIILLFVFILPDLTHSQIRWEITFGTYNDDNYLFNKTIDYDYGILFNWDTKTPNCTYMSKMDKNGNELWRKATINTGTTTVPIIILSDDNQVVFGGSTLAYPFIVSMDKCYNINWCSNFINTQLFNSGGFEDAVLLENGDVLAVAYLEPPDPFINRTDRIFLFYYNSSGELLWYRLYASGEDYPLMDTPFPIFITKFTNYFIISGVCWYPYPDNPDLMVMRPLFIRIDSSFNEQFVLPYGVEDSVVGIAAGVIEDKQTGENIGVGRYAGIPDVFSLTPFMRFDSLGNETGMYLLPNDSIGEGIQSNSSLDIVSLGDTNYLLTSYYGTNQYGNPVGEILLDSSYNVITTLSHENTGYNVTRIDTLPDNELLFGVNIYENPPTNNNRDILFYKLYADLSQVAPDTNNYVYDSLCDHPITSDTIYLNDCDVITTVPEFPSPKAYKEAKQKVEITAYPNPAADRVNFKLKNTRFQSNMELSVYNISGKLLMRQNIVTGQKEAGFNIGGLPSGIYVAVIGNRQKVLGKALFSVR